MTQTPSLPTLLPLWAAALAVASGAAAVGAAVAGAPWPAGAAGALVAVGGVAWLARHARAAQRRLTELQAGRELVSATFVIPYPPGFPVLVPGQVISPEIVEFLSRIDIEEIHGYRPELGLTVFSAEALASAAGRFAVAED